MSLASYHCLHPGSVTTWRSRRRRRSSRGGQRLFLRPRPAVPAADARGGQIHRAVGDQVPVTADELLAVVKSETVADKVRHHVQSREPGLDPAHGGTSFPSRPGSRPQIDVGPFLGTGNE